MSRYDLAINGGGLLGRLIAWRAALQGITVALYDADDRDGRGATAWVAGGMIAPLAEAVDIDLELVEMGRRSLALWPAWLSELSSTVHYADCGTLVVWRRSEAEEAKRFEMSLKARVPRPDYQRLDADHLAVLEPALESRFREGFLLRGDAHIDNRQLLPALAGALDEAGVVCHWHRPVADSEELDASLVIDCRGRSARNRWKELRCVRGEIARLHAPGIELQHMVRLLHPRFSAYLICRPGGHLVVGATSIESDDSSPVSVRGALELLTAAYGILPELGEARILELNTGCRPALPDNRPRVRFDPRGRLLEVNGLYRHGFLLSPAIVEEVTAVLPKLLCDPSADIRQEGLLYSLSAEQWEERNLCQLL
jgi:glycine oxidase